MSLGLVGIMMHFCFKRPMKKSRLRVTKMERNSRVRTKTPASLFRERAKSYNDAFRPEGGGRGLSPELSDLEPYSLYVRAQE